MPWVRCVSKRTGRAYFFNNETGESRWTDPRKRPREEPARGGAARVSQGYASVGESSRKGRRDLPTADLTAWNNFGKACLLMEMCGAFDAPIRALDIGCGRGGDVAKWKHAMPEGSSLVGFDNCHERIQMARRRAADVEFLDGSFTGRWPVAEDSSVHVAACFFAMHYAWESARNATHFMRELARVLRPDGIAALLVPACDVVVQHSLKMLTESAAGEKLFTIGFIDPKLLETAVEKPFGIGYTFSMPPHVPELREYLVTEDSVRTLAREFGMDVISSRGWMHCLDGYRTHPRFEMTRKRMLPAKTAALEAVGSSVGLYWVFIVRHVPTNAP